MKGEGFKERAKILKKLELFSDNLDFVLCLFFMKVMRDYERLRFHDLALSRRMSFLQYEITL